MSALVVDALKFSKQLRQAGVPDNQAETFMEALSAFAAEREEQATKRDLREMEDRQEIKLAEIKRDMKDIESRQEIRMAELQRDMKDMETGLKRDMKDMETGLKRDIAELEVRLRHELDLIRLEMRDLERRMTIKLGSLMVVAVSVVAVLVKLL